MNQTKIPTVLDPDSFMENRPIHFPCATQFMRYDGLTHKYYLTTQALQKYGIELDGALMTALPNNADLFLEEVSDDVYGAIMRIAPFNYQYSVYLVANSISRQFTDKYTARKQFEKALVYQAQYKVMNVDVRDFNGIDLESGNSIYHKQLRKEMRHISPKTLDILQALGLLFNGHIPGKHLINYQTMI